MDTRHREFAPVVLFTYNRPWHVRQAVEALARNDEAAETDLLVYSDGPKNDRAVGPVGRVRDYIRSLSGFKSISIVERPQNYGLSKSIVDGVTTVCDRFRRVIVLEDDLVTSQYFLKYMNDGLRRYESDDRIASIHGYFYPVDTDLPSTVFTRGADCLGWGTWKRAWDLFESDGTKLLAELLRTGLTKRFDLDGSYPYTQMLRDQIEGRNDSWAIRWHASTFLKGKLALNPGRSLVKHIGNDGSGTNCAFDSMLDTEVAHLPVPVGDIEVEESVKARDAVAKFFATHRSSFVRQLLRNVRSAARNWRD